MVYVKEWQPLGSQGSRYEGKRNIRVSGPLVQDAYLGVPSHPARHLSQCVPIVLASTPGVRIYSTYSLSA